MTQPDPDPDAAAQGMGRCEVCQQPVPTIELVSHLAVEHPDVYEPFETWPDGQIVVLDSTLEPADFALPPDRDWRTVRIDRRDRDGRLIGEPVFARVDGLADVSVCGLCGAESRATGMLPHLRDDHPDLFAATASVDLTVLDDSPAFDTKDFDPRREDE